MRYLLFYLLYAVINYPAFSQDTIRDSLKRVLDTKLSPANTVDTYNALAWQEIISGNFTQAQSYLEKADKLAKKHSYTEGKIQILRGFGIVQEKAGNYIEALAYQEKALKLAQKLKIDPEIAKGYKEVGVVYFNQGNYDKALEYFQKSLKTSEKMGDTQGIANNLNNIGMIYHNLKDYPKSMEYYRKTLEMDKKVGSPRGIAYTLNNIATTYEKQGKYEQARDYYERSLAIKKRLKDRLGIANTLGNLGIVYEKQKNYPKAESYYQQSLEIKQTLGNKFRLTSAFNALGEFYYKQGKFNLGRQYCQKSLEIAQEINAQYRINVAAKTLMELEEKANDKAKAYEYAQIYMQTKDSLFNEDKAKTIGKLEAKYAFDKREQSLKLQQAQKEYELNQKIQQQNYLLYGVVLALLFIVIIAVIYYRYSKRLKELNATKDKLFAIVAHDLKNPLSAFRSITQSLSENLNQISQEEIQYFLDKINKSSSQLYNLLQNLLQWAINQTGQLEYKPQNTDLQILSNSIIEQLQTSAELKKLQINNLIDTSQQVFADEKMTRLIFRNLLSNAIKFTPQDGKITLSTLKKDKHIQIEVQDTGIGISKTDQAKLFQIATDNKRVGDSPEKGTGLGLILCQELVRKQGGKIWVESEENKGSRFIFTLPIQGV